MNSRSKTQKKRKPSPPDFRAVDFRIGPDDYVVLSFCLNDMARLSGLSPAEQEVVLHLLQGRSNREIARLRNTSERTVANQATSVYRKLNVRNRTQLAALAASLRFFLKK